MMISNVHTCLGKAFMSVTMAMLSLLLGGCCNAPVCLEPGLLGEPPELVVTVQADSSKDLGFPSPAIGTVQVGDEPLGILVETKEDRVADVVWSGVSGGVGGLAGAGMMLAGMAAATPPREQRTREAIGEAPDGLDLVDRFQDSMVGALEHEFTRSSVRVDGHCESRKEGTHLVLEVQMVLSGLEHEMLPRTTATLRLHHEGKTVWGATFLHFGPKRPLSGPGGWQDDGWRNLRQEARQALLDLSSAIATEMRNPQMRAPDDVRWGAQIGRANLDRSVMDYQHDKTYRLNAVFPSPRYHVIQRDSRRTSLQTPLANVVYNVPSSAVTLRK